jgi:hypothetical protein
LQPDHSLVVPVADDLKRKVDSDRGAVVLGKELERDLPLLATHLYQGNSANTTLISTQGKIYVCVSAMDLLTKLYLLCVLYRFNIGEDGSPFYSQVLIKALQVKISNPLLS